MPRWGWLGVGFGAGVAASGVAVMIWTRQFVRNWDRAWGWQ